VFGEIGRVGCRDLLHSRREVGCVTEGRVVHAQIVADLADHNLSRIESHAYREADPFGDAQLVRVAAQRFAQVQCGIASALREVFVRDRGTEQRHDAIATVLVDRAFEAVNAFGQDLEEPIHDAVPFFRVEFGASSVDPLTSANRIVTCLRSPSRALRDVRIFSTRCFGVYERGSRSLVFATA
jgi:hypothetical protein